MTSLPRAITIVSPDTSNATITWDYDACRFIDEVAFQIGQVSLRALVKKDLFDDNIFAWNCVFVQGPPGSIVYYRIQVVPSKEEGQRTSRRAAAEGILSHSQMRCSHSFGTNYHQRAIVVVSASVEPHDPPATESLALNS